MRTYRPSRPAALALGLLVLTGLSCVTRSPRQVVSRPDEAGPRPAEAGPKPDQAVRELQARVDERNLQILQKDALILQLEERLQAQQRSLDRAIQEVVRTKAKQRSVGSRAQAASEMAEAEIALKSLRLRAAEADGTGLAQAEQLMQLAVEEFEKENFGGALYLTSRAKGLIKRGTLEADDDQKVGRLVGETPFAAPVALVVKTASNLRKGPGLEFEILEVLAQGTTVSGYSFKGAWLHVQNGDGTNGWVHRSLVSAS